MATLPATKRRARHDPKTSGVAYLAGAESPKFCNSASRFIGDRVIAALFGQRLPILRQDEFDELAALRIYPADAPITISKKNFASPQKPHNAQAENQWQVGRFKMTTIKQLLTEKGNDVFTIGPHKTFYEALKEMSERNIGSLVVVEDGIPVGIVTERLYAREIALKGRSSPSTLVGDVMETNVIYAKPDQSVEECMAVMTTKRIRHLPVIYNDSLVGIISIGDLVKSIIEHHEFVIEQLVHYINC